MRGRTVPRITAIGHSQRDQQHQEKQEKIQETKHLPSNFTTTVSSSKKYKTSFHKEHKNNIVLDTGCSVPALYCNPALVYDIRPASEPLCMATSTGMVYLTKKATVPVIGEVWYDPDQPTNLLSFGHMVERFKIKHDTQDDTFNLQMKNGDNMKFVKKNYLYTYTPSRQYMQTIRRTKQKRRSRNRGHRMKTRSHTRSNQPVIGMSNLCLTHADTNQRDPWQQSRFAGVPDSIGDRSDQETDNNGTDADDNGNTTEYYDNEIDNNGTETDDEASNNGDRSDNEIAPTMRQAPMPTTMASMPMAMHPNTETPEVHAASSNKCDPIPNQNKNITTTMTQIKMKDGNKSTDRTENIQQPEINMMTNQNKNTTTTMTPPVSVSPHCLSMSRQECVGGTCSTLASYRY